MADGNITITAKYGPGLTATSTVFSSAKKVTFDMDKEIVEITDKDGIIHHFDYETVATVTYTISGEVATITIST